MDERFDQTIQNMLTKYIGQKKSMWEDYLDECVFAYNTSHESSKFIPLELMFARKPILPVDIHEDCARIARQDIFSP